MVNPSTLNSFVERSVICPACGGISVYAPSNPARPFCSARCKNVDFGAWASENFRVPTDAAPENLELSNAHRQ